MTFTLRGVRLTLDFPLAAMLTVYALLGGGDMLAVSLLSSAVHELGHLAALKMTGGRPDSIRLTARGVIISAGRPPSIAFVLGGVCANFAAAALSMPAVRVSRMCALICAANAAMGIINLIPARPLDGAQALWLALGRWPFGDKLCSALSAVSCIALSAGGLYLLMRSQANFSLLFLSLWLLAALFDKLLDDCPARG